jgi:hypothetical protein
MTAGPTRLRALLALDDPLPPLRLPLYLNDGRIWQDDGDGLGEDERAVIVEAVNALPALLDRLERAEAALGAITLAVGDRTFMLNDDGVTRTVVQFGTGELISATTGRPLGPDEFAVSGISTTDPLVAALARAIELVGPDRISLGHTLPPRAALAASEPPEAPK